MYFTLYCNSQSMEMQSIFSINYFILLYDFFLFKQCIVVFRNVNLSTTYYVSIISQISQTMPDLQIYDKDSSQEWILTLLMLLKVAFKCAVFCISLHVIYYSHVIINNAYN